MAVYPLNKVWNLTIEESGSLKTYLTSVCVPQATYTNKFIDNTNV